MIAKQILTRITTFTALIAQVKNRNHLVSNWK